MQASAGGVPFLAYVGPSIERASERARRRGCCHGTIMGKEPGPEKGGVTGGCLRQLQHNGPSVGPGKKM